MSFSGVVGGKKRKRIQSDGFKRTSEIKQFNMLISNSDTYTELTMGMDDGTGESNYLRAYTARNLFWPTQGVDDHQRIGNKVNLKYIRFKGHVKVYGNLVHAVSHWRLYLIRTTGVTIANVNYYFTNFSTIDWSAAASVLVQILILILLLLLVLMFALFLLVVLLVEYMMLHHVVLVNHHLV